MWCRYLKWEKLFDPLYEISSEPLTITYCQSQLIFASITTYCGVGCFFLEHRVFLSLFVSLPMLSVLLLFSVIEEILLMSYVIVIFWDCICVTDIDVVILSNTMQLLYWHCVGRHTIVECQIVRSFCQILRDYWLLLCCVANRVSWIASASSEDGVFCAISMFCASGQVFRWFLCPLLVECHLWFAVCVIGCVWFMYFTSFCDKWGSAQRCCWSNQRAVLSRVESSIVNWSTLVT